MEIILCVDRVPSCACQPLSGKVFQYFSLKWAYPAFLTLFEIGSLTCAMAPSSIVLIIGRTVAGFGAAGLFSGALIIVAHITPLRLRACTSVSSLCPSAESRFLMAVVYTGILTSSFGLASIVGPVVGGALMQHATWWWCMSTVLPSWYELPSTAHSNKLLHQSAP